MLHYDAPVQDFDVEVQWKAYKFQVYVCITMLNTGNFCSSTAEGPDTYTPHCALNLSEQAGEYMNILLHSPCVLEMRTCTEIWQARQAPLASLLPRIHGWPWSLASRRDAFITRSHHQRCLLHQPRTLPLQPMWLQLSVAWACLLLPLWALHLLPSPLCCRLEKSPAQSMLCLYLVEKPLMRTFTHQLC